MKTYTELLHTIGVSTNSQTPNYRREKTQLVFLILRLLISFETCVEACKLR